MEIAVSLLWVTKFNEGATSLYTAQDELERLF